MTVVAVFELSPLMMTCTGTRRPASRSFLKPSRNHQHRPRLAAIDQLFVLAGAGHLAHELEVSGIDERGDQVAGLPACGRCPERQAGCSARRNSGRIRRAAERTPARTTARAATDDRAQSGGTLCGRPQGSYACSTTSRNTSSSDGMTRSMPSIDSPRSLEPAPSARPDSRPAVRSTACTAVPKTVGLFDLRHVFERSHHVDRTS